MQALRPMGMEEDGIAQRRVVQLHANSSDRAAPSFTPSLEKPYRQHLLKAKYSELNLLAVQDRLPQSVQDTCCDFITQPIDKSWYVCWSVWACSCLFLCASSVHLLDSRHVDLLYIHYSPFIPMLLMMWLWCFVVSGFEKQNIQYQHCFSKADQASLPAARHLLKATVVATLLLLSSATAFAYCSALGQNVYAAYQPPLLYVLAAILLLLPANILAKSARYHFWRTLCRVLLPIREVTWSDFLLADMLTSLARPLADLSRACCHVARRHTMDSYHQGCEGMAWLAPLITALPFMWRLAQCLRVFRDTRSLPQLWNALKYASALPAIWVWGLRSIMSPYSWALHFQVWYLLVATGSSVFSYFWDVERDWEISYFVAAKGKGRAAFPFGVPTLKPELLYSPDWYYYLMCSNLFLRFSWLTRLVAVEWATSPFGNLLLGCLEVIRRFQWTYVRIEVELRRVQAQRPDLGVLVPVTHSSVL